MNRSTQRVIVADESFERDFLYRLRWLGQRHWRLPLLNLAGLACLVGLSFLVFDGIAARVVFCLVGMWLLSGPIEAVMSSRVAFGSRRSNETAEHLANLVAFFFEDDSKLHHFDSFDVDSLTAFFSRVNRRRRWRGQFDRLIGRLCHECGSEADKAPRELADE